MMPDVLPPQQKKTEAVIRTLTALADDKMKEEAAALKTAEDTADPNEKRLAAALARSHRIMAEDLMREAGYMLPQSANAHELLVSMLDHPASDFPVKTAEKLLEMLKVNE
jgi:glycine/serine hydroxymethyltransferase